MALWYRWEGTDLILSVRAQPRASRDEICAPLDDALKVRITAPPVEGQANEHLRKFLAKTFGVSMSRVALLSGDTGRNKRFCIQSPTQLITGITPANSAPKP